MQIQLTIVGLLFLFNALPVFACTHGSRFASQVDKDVSISLRGINAIDNYIVNADVGQQMIRGTCTDAWNTIISIDGHPYPNYDGLYTVSQYIIDDTAQMFTISEGPQYGVDFMNASHRISLDHVNHLAGLTASLSADSEQIAMIPNRSADLVKQRVNMKSPSFTTFVSSDVKKVLDDRKNLADGVKLYHQNTISTQKLDQDNHYFIARTQSSMLGTTPVMVLQAGRGKVINCNATVNDGNAYLLLDKAINKLGAIPLLAAVNSDRPLQLKIVPGMINVDGVQSSYCIVKDITAM